MQINSIILLLFLITIENYSSNNGEYNCLGSLKKYFSLPIPKTIPSALHFIRSLTTDDIGAIKTILLDPNIHPHQKSQLLHYCEEKVAYKTLTEILYNEKRNNNEKGIIYLLTNSAIALKAILNNGSLLSNNAFLIQMNFVPGISRINSIKNDVEANKEEIFARNNIQYFASHNDLEQATNQVKKITKDLSKTKLQTATALLAIPKKNAAKILNELEIKEAAKILEYILFFLSVPDFFRLHQIQKRTREDLKKKAIREAQTKTADLVRIIIDAKKYYSQIPVTKIELILEKDRYETHFKELLKNEFLDEKNESNALKIVLGLIQSMNSKKKEALIMEILSKEK